MRTALQFAAFLPVFLFLLCAFGAWQPTVAAYYAPGLSRAQLLLLAGLCAASYVLIRISIHRLPRR